MSDAGRSSSLDDGCDVAAVDGQLFADVHVERNDSLYMARKRSGRYQLARRSRPQGE